MRSELPAPRLAISALLAFAALAEPVLADGQQEKEYASEMNAYVQLLDTSRVFLALGVTKRQPDDLTKTAVGSYLDITLKPILRQNLREADWERGRYLLGPGRRRAVWQLSSPLQRAAYQRGGNGPGRTAAGRVAGEPSSRRFSRR